MTNLITRELGRKGLALLNYHVGVVAAIEAEATWHFGMLRALLDKLGLDEAQHKSPPPLQVNMVLLGLGFNKINMTVSIPDDKLEMISTFVRNWSHKSSANVHEL